QVTSTRRAMVAGVLYRPMEPSRGLAELLGQAPVTAAGSSHMGDQLLDPVVHRPEEVLAQDGSLRLVVQLEVHPVDCVVAAPLLGVADALPTEVGPGRLRRLPPGLLGLLLGD